ncbi:MAG: hypothetical protein ABIV06_03655 [Thermoanaerobaculia bacterium]
MRRSAHAVAPGIVLALLSVVAVPSPAPAMDGSVWDQSRFVQSLEVDITANILANDFVVADYSYLQSIDVWLADGLVNDNGTLDGFSGQLYWRIYSSTGSTPNVPLRDGRGVAVQLTDTGLQTAAGSDMIRVHFDLEPPVPLNPGTYWFGLHEGIWGVSDGTPLKWLAAYSDVGSPAAGAANSPTPASWTNVSDPAMVLYSGFLVHGGVDNGIAGSSALNLANVAAADFYCDGLTRLTSADVWLADNQVNDNGLFDSFSGTLGWGLIADNNAVPGLTLASGTVTPRLFDSLLQDPFGGDIFRARIRLPPLPAIENCAGWNWLALHEGAWGSAADGSPAWWQAPAQTFGALAYWAPATPNPTGWTEATIDVSVALFDDLIFGSGFEAGVTCAWSQFSSGTCP